MADHTQPRNEYNEKVRQLGVWIDKEFLQNLFRRNFDAKVKILGHDIQAAVNPGDNYLGTLYRTTVEYKEDNSDEILVKKLMIKGAPAGQVLVDMVEDTGVFDKEVFMYNEFLVAMRGIFQQYFPRTTPFIAPYSLKCSRHNTLVMEDLGDTNYKMADRKLMLDFNHSVEVLRTMARFHALSKKVFQNYPEYEETDILSKDIYTDNPCMEPLIFGCIPVFTEVIKSWEGCGSYIPLFRDLGEAWKTGLVKKMVAPGSFNVINHGDLWVNNILFLYNEDGSVDHAKFVDYQLSRITTPALDILYFMFSSVQTDAMVDKMNLLLREYFNTLMESLALLKINVDYTFTQLKEDFVSRLAFGMFAMIQIKPIMLVEKEYDLESSEGNDISVNFKNPKYKSATIAILGLLESMGYLSSLHSDVKAFLNREVVESEAKEDKEGATIAGSPSMIDRFLSSVSRMMSNPVCT